MLVDEKLMDVSFHVSWAHPTVWAAGEGRILALWPSQEQRCSSSSGVPNS